MRLWSLRGMPKAEVQGQGDGAMYGLPNRLRALLPDPTTGELRWESAGRDLVDGDEWICARADALLGRLEAAAAASGETYDAVLAAAPGPFVG